MTRLHSVVWPAPITALLISIAALLAYLPGLDRPYSWDESITVHRFVATPSILDALRRQVEYNNHPLLSLVDHMLYTLTGSSGEALMRFVPLLAVVTAIGLCTHECTRRLGALPGLCCGLLIAVNPVVVDAARTARGYGLVMLCAVGATMVAMRLVEGSTSRTAGALYVVACALGVASQLYMLFVIAIHVAFVLTSRRCSPLWIARWVLGLTLGGMMYVGLAAEMFHSQVAGEFRPGFVSELGEALLGSGIAALVVLPVIAAGIALGARGPGMVAAIGAGAVLVLGDIVVLHPAYLYPRFFVWAVPGVATLCALAVRRAPSLAILVMASAAVAVSAMIPRTTLGDVASRTAAATVVAAHERGDLVCVDNAAPLEAYDAAAIATVPRTLRELAACDTVVLLYAPGPEAAAALLAGWPYTGTLPAITPGQVWSRRPIPSVGN